MQKLVKEYLNELKRKQKKRRRIGIAAVLLIVMVAGAVIGILTQAGVAMTGDAVCGLEEHQHNESCYEDVAGCGLEESEGHQHNESCYEVQSTLVCTAEETEEHQHGESCYDTQNIPICGQEETDGHQHDSSCMEQQLVCGIEEHTHTDMCYIDSEADVEDASVWEAQYAQTPWTGNWGEDLVTAAKMQLDYQESASNYTTAEDGVHKGYTRYGQFSGDAYMDWDAAFVNFCMYYAGLKESGLFPEETDSGKWLEEFGKIREDHSTYLAAPEEYSPKAGDIVFFQRDDGETPVQMGIVTSYEEDGTIQVIEGNSENAVKENSYPSGDSRITGYLKITELESVGKGSMGESEESPEGTAEAEKSDETAEPRTKKPMQKAAVRTADSAGNPLTGDDAYVNSIEITSIKDGAAPFDNDDAAGNDSKADNKRVRTFDAVTYNFSVNMKSWKSSEQFSEARVKFEFVLPASEDEAVFDQTAMAWMDTTVTDTKDYRPQLTKEKRTIDGKETDCQVLTCYRYLIPSGSNPSVIPGDFGNNVTINVKSMGNGREFAPIFSACMEHGTWEGTCGNDEHKINGSPAEEKKTVTADKVTVTAAPKYNIQVRGDSSYKSIFDFSTGYSQEDAENDSNKSAAANKDKGSIPGRVMKLGITLQLYNDNASKGLKGIELPKGDITFQLKVSSRYTITRPNKGYESGQEFDTSADYTPLLWSYGENRWIDYKARNTDGRELLNSLGNMPFAPNYTGEKKTDCYNSGKWTASQEGDTIYVTVRDYVINPDHMPTRNGDDGTDVYQKNVGCFSAGGFWIVQPFNKIKGTGADPYYDIVNKYGSGAFATTVRAENLQAETVSGTRVQDGVDGFFQKVTTDDEEARTLELTTPGSMHNRVRYAGADINKGSGIEDTRDGRDYAAVGSELWLMGGFSYSANSEDENQLYWGTNLCKFYGSAIQLEDEWQSALTGEASLDGKTNRPDVDSNIQIYYAVKKDGSDWANDDELLRTYEDDLDFYPALNEIPKDSICVGILYCFKGPGPVVASDPYYNCFHKAKVRENMELAGKTFMLASTARVWTKQMFNEANMNLSNIPDWSNPGTALNDFPENHLKSANIDNEPFYRKETYKADGSGIYATHNSDWGHYGDTLLVIGFKTRITKNLLQKDTNNDDKKTFNLDAEQRVVDFKLQPGTYYDKSGDFDRSSNITIVDTMPEYLTYKPGSAYFGGTYTQTSDFGGTKGAIDGGTLQEPVTGWDDKGRQTLTWVIPDVKIGSEMPPIYYSADIGTKGNPDKDVPIGTTKLENEVYITAPYDRRIPTLENGNYAKEGISVVRGTASSFGKYTKQKVVDEDGEIDYVAYFSNNAETAADVEIMDTMPADGVNGSKFTGTYQFTGWKVDNSECDIGKIAVYYTFDQKYKDKVISDVKKENINIAGSPEWEKASLQTDGSIAIPDETPVAWAVIGTLDAGKSVRVNLKIKLNPGESSQDRKDTNYFVNRLSSGDTTTTTETPTVRRTLEGLTWMDYNRDGIQNEDASDRISGVKVELLRLKEEGANPENESSYLNVCYPGTNTPIVIETGKQISVRAEPESAASNYEKGRYKFTDLPAGIFAVRFTDGSKTKIAELNAAKRDCGSDDTLDSDGIPVYSSDGSLEKTLILNIGMPRAEELSVALYESKYHDSGFYPDTVLNIQKKDERGNKSLEGAIFTIKDSEGLISFTADKKSCSYTVSREEKNSSGEQQYYIAFAKNTNYVLGFNGTGDGSQSILQSRSGSKSQLFTMVNDGEGSCSFHNVESGRWLDLDSGKLEDGAKIHLWSNTKPNENQKWKIENNQDGSYYIHPAQNGGDNWCIDLEYGVAEENRTIFLYSANQSQAQKWMLIPAGNDAETQTDLSVGDDGCLTINDLAPGTYSLEEIKSPDGYSLLKEPVKITLGKDGSISLPETNNGMAEITGTGTDLLLTIYNHELYELPSAGGTGIYWYTIGGMLLMMAASLILYKNRCKEVLRR